MEDEGPYLPIFKVKSNLGLPERIHAIVDEHVDQRISAQFALTYVLLQLHHEMSRFIFLDILESSKGERSNIA